MKASGILKDVIVIGAGPAGSAAAMESGYEAKLCGRHFQRDEIIVEKLVENGIIKQLWHEILSSSPEATKFHDGNHCGLSKLF